MNNKIMMLTLMFISFYKKKDKSNDILISHSASVFIAKLTSR